MKFIITIVFFCVSWLTFAQEYKLAAGDEIKILVYGESDLTTQVKINKSGMLSFPFLADLSALGLTTAELALKIADGLRGDYLVNPQVSISIVAYRPFFIHGQVRKPGGYPYQDDLTLDKAIALAGGLSARASRSDWKITRVVAGEKVILAGSATTLILPDDTIEIEQSFF